MRQLLDLDFYYVVSVEEILWGGLMLSITMAIHGTGMLLTLHVSNVMKRWLERLNAHFFVFGLSVLIVAAWMIILVHLVEVTAWARFYVLKGAIVNPSAAFYYALVNYTTLESGYLPQRWRLLEGLIAMAGLMTFAWSTGVLFMLAKEFQERHLGPRHK